MNKQYQDLFQLVARNGALHAEQTAEVLKAKENNEKEMAVIMDMRDRFNALEDKIIKSEELSITDYIQLYAGAMVTRNTIQKNIDTWTAVIEEYDNNLIPKLYEVANETDAIKRLTLIEDFFS